MKKVIITIVIAAFLTGPLLIFAQNPPHPNGGNTPGSGNSPVGGGAPLDGGLIILMGMGFYYGIKKVLRAENKDNN